MNLNSTRANGARSGNSRAKAIQPWAAVLGGGALAIYGLSRKSLGGTALAAVGALGAIAGAKRSTLTPTAIHVQKTFTIDRPAEDLYHFWRSFENLPRFMKHLISVTTKGSRFSHWVARGPAGVPIEWDAEVVDERPGEYLVWCSLPGSAISHRGSVEFRPSTNGAGTEVTVALTYHNPVGKIGAAFAKMMGRDPERQVREDLRRFKALMETGEIPTVVGQPSGRRSSAVKVLHSMKEPEATQQFRKGPHEVQAAKLKPQFAGVQSGGVR